MRQPGHLGLRSSVDSLGHFATSDHGHKLEIHQITPVRSPFLKQPRVLCFHQLKTAPSRGVHPTSQVLQPRWRHPATFTETTVHCNTIRALELLNHHEEHSTSSSFRVCMPHNVPGQTTCRCHGTICHLLRAPRPFTSCWSSSGAGSGMSRRARRRRRRSVLAVVMRELACSRLMHICLSHTEPLRLQLRRSPAPTDLSRVSQRTGPGPADGWPDQQCDQ